MSETSLLKKKFCKVLSLWYKKKQSLPFWLPQASLIQRTVFQYKDIKHIKDLTCPNKPQTLKNIESSPCSVNNTFQRIAPKTEEHPSRKLIRAKWKDKGPGTTNGRFVEHKHKCCSLQLVAHRLSCSTQSIEQHDGLMMMYQASSECKERLKREPMLSETYSNYQND